MKMLYSFGYCGFCMLGMDTVWLLGALLTGSGAEGMDDAQVSENTLAELGIMSGDGAPLTWASMEVAWDWEGKVRKQ